MASLAAPARKLLFAFLFMALVSQRYIEVARAANSEAHRRLLQSIDCKAACGERCKAASLNDRCLRACGTCCARCKCVPPGTYGNRELCPCYANMTTHGNRTKCP